MKFGDIIVRQLTGIAIGMSPTPPIVILYLAIHKRSQVLSKFESLDFYRQFIEDGFATWKHHPNHNIDSANYKPFQDAICSRGLD